MQESTLTLEQRAQKIKLVIFDVDGVLTDGGLYFSAQGEAMKQFCSLDGHGVKMLKQAGIQTAIITGRQSEIVSLRAREMNIDHLFQGVSNKLPFFLQLQQQLKLQAEECAYMGDDWPDLPILKRCGFAAAPNNAHDEVKKQVHWISTQKGGHGAVRQWCDLLLKATGHYQRLLNGEEGIKP